MPYGEVCTRFRVIRSTLLRHKGFPEYINDYFSCVMSGFILRIFFLPVALRPNAGHSLLILEVSRSHTTTHHIR